MDKIAILLIAHKGLDYIDKFCEQFNNDERFNIYIHIDKKIEYKNKIDSILKKYNNIKYIISEYDGLYFGISLVNIMFSLLSLSVNDSENIYHICCSETDYRIKSLDYIYNYLLVNDTNYFPIKFSNTYNNTYFYSGSQWFTINSAFAKYLISIKNTPLYDTVAYLIDSYRKLYNVHIAYDEFLLQTIIAKSPNIIDKFKININSSLHYVDFHYISNGHSPEELQFKNLEYYIKTEICDNLFVRKIDYKNIDSKKLVNVLLELNTCNSKTEISCLPIKKYNIPKLTEIYNLLTTINSINILNLSSDTDYNILYKFISKTSTYTNLKIVEDLNDNVNVIVIDKQNLKQIYSYNIKSLDFIFFNFKYNRKIIALSKKYNKLLLIRNNYCIFMNK